MPPIMNIETDIYNAIIDGEIEQEQLAHAFEYVGLTEDEAERRAHSLFLAARALYESEVSLEKMQLVQYV